MIPVNDGLLLENTVTTNKKSYLTYKLVQNKISGFTDGQDALVQAIDLLMQTERFAYAIFTHNYGVELEELFSVNPDLFEARLKLRIEEALLCDERILGISSFSVIREKSKVFVSMTITSIYGNMYYERNI